MMRNNKGVIINVYIESSKLKSDQRNDPIKRINPKLFSCYQPKSVIRTRGYDRRAQLLAYAQELRQANAQQIECPFNNSMPKQKKWRWSLPMQKIKKLFSGFRVTNGSWKYEPIITEDCNDADGSCNRETMRHRKRKASGRRNSHFCKKLKCLLKEICGAWHCKSGIC